MKKSFVERINEVLKSKNLTQSDLSRLTGITQSSISEWVRGKFIPKQDKIFIIAKALQVSPSYLMGEEARESELTLSAPLLGKIACGQPIEAVEDLEWIEVNETCDYCLRADGNSMIGIGIYDGDLVLLDKTEHLENGEIGAVHVGDSITLKKFYYYPENNSIILKAANPEVEDQLYTGENIKKVRIIGKMKRMTRKY